MAQCVRDNFKHSEEIMSILVIGGSGFIGRQLCKSLLDEGHTVVVKTRNVTKTKAIFEKLQCSPTIIKTLAELEPFESSLNSVISLTGAGIIDKRWTTACKEALIESRTQPLLELKSWLQTRNIAIEKLLVGSAIGYYGFSNNPDEEFVENSEHFDHFSHDLCKQLEDTSHQLDRIAENVVQLRTGVVLGKKGGALQKMAVPAKFHLNGPIGNGKQWVSWIHMQDWVNAVKYILTLKTPRNRYNLTSPNPATNGQMSAAIGSALNKLFQLPIPAVSLKFILGEASILLTGSQKVMPANLQAANFEFLYPTIDSACKDLLSN